MQYGDQSVNNWSIRQILYLKASLHDINLKITMKIQGTVLTIKDF